MSTVVTGVVAKLEGLKAKVEETIAHVESGVTTLNEDQVDKAVELFNGLEAEVASVKKESLSLLGRAEVAVESVVQKAESQLAALKEKVEEALGIEGVTK